MLYKISKVYLHLDIGSSSFETPIGKTLAKIHQLQRPVSSIMRLYFNLPTCDNKQRSCVPFTLFFLQLSLQKRGCDDPSSIYEIESM